MRKILFVAIALFSIASCQSPKEVSVTGVIVGSWTQPIPGMDGVQGITINADGTAKSINMSTLLYESWKQSGDTIVLKGKSIGNGQTIDFTDECIVTLLSADSLILTSGQNAMKYVKQSH